MKRILVLCALASSVPLVACGDSGSSGDDPDDGGSGSGAAGAGAGGPGNGGSTGSASNEPAELNGITAAHNEARASVVPAAATPLTPLTWDAGIAATAQAYAENCVFEHSGGQYGENLYANTGTTTPQEVVAGWVSEVADYDYASNSCSGVCGHYTQVVWADSLRLGCGVAICDASSSPFGSGQSWQNWVCNYDPPGNFIGEQPY